MHFLLLAFPAQTVTNCSQHSPEISVSAWGEISKSPTEKAHVIMRLSLTYQPGDRQGMQEIRSMGQLCEKTVVS